MRRRRTPSKVEDQWAHWHLEQWGAWARGMPSYLGYPADHSRGTPTPIEDVAEQTERAMLKLKQRRPELFQFAVCRYVLNQDELTTCRKLKIRGTNYDQHKRQLYSFIDGALG